MSLNSCFFLRLKRIKKPSMNIDLNFVPRNVYQHSARSTIESQGPSISTIWVEGLRFTITNELGNEIIFSIPSPVFDFVNTQIKYSVGEEEKVVPYKTNSANIPRCSSDAIDKRRPLLSN